jgi:hypothetical protein
MSPTATAMCGGHFRSWALRASLDFFRAVISMHLLVPSYRPAPGYSTRVQRPSDRATARAAFVLSAPRNLLQFLLFSERNLLQFCRCFSAHFFLDIFMQDYAVCPSLCVTTRTDRRIFRVDARINF